MQKWIETCEYINFFVVEKEKTNEQKKGIYVYRNQQIAVTFPSSVRIGGTTS